MTGSKLVLGCLVLFLAVSSGTAGPGLAQGEKVYLAGSSAESADMLFHVAKRNGFFSSEGLDVELVVTRANISIAGMAGKNIDYGTVLGSVVRAALGGVPVRLVMINMDRPSQALVGRPDIKNIAELRGKTIGVSGIGSMADVITRMVLERSGLNPEHDVQIAPLGPMSARISALEQGLVAAASVTPPTTFQLEKRGFHILANAADLVVFPYYGLGTTEEKIREQPGQVKKMIRAFLRTGRFIREEKAQMIAIIMEAWRMDRESAARSYEALRPVVSASGEPDGESMKFWIDLVKKELGIKSDVPLSRVADFTILQAAQKELGLN